LRKKIFQRAGRQKLGRRGTKGEGEESQDKELRKENTKSWKLRDTWENK